MRHILLATLFLLPAATTTAADLHELQRLLGAKLLDPDTTFHEAQAFCESRVPRMPEVDSPEDWSRIAADLRERALREVVLRGEAAAWVKLPTKVQWFDAIDCGDKGYRIRKLRYEAVPGLWIPALLYEPLRLAGKVPVMLNVNGHDAKGKSADYKQVRCINQAKRGILSLNVEWINMGQLRGPDFDHYCLNQLDLCGTSGIALHYLAQKRALDVLLQHEHADPERVGVSGLSGGGWQTIFISGLDDRVTLSNPVAGYSSFRTRARVLPDLGDSEQTPCDLATVLDYTHLTAMLAPHPLLLTNNDRDQCCFQAGNALPLLLESARPIYRLYDATDNLWAHINHVPGSHNYLQDNREALYRLIAAHWFPAGECPVEEFPSAREVKTAEELNVPLPDGNAGFNTIARRLATEIVRRKAPATAEQIDAARQHLAKVVHSRRLKETSREEVSLPRLSGDNPPRVKGRVIQIAGEWSLPAIDLIQPDADRWVIVLCDEGRKAAADHIARLVASGASVEVIDPFYFGESKISQKDFLYGLLVAAVGERPLGIQVDQVRAVARHLSHERKVLPVEIHALGRRTSLIALIAAALEPEAVSAVELHGGLTTLGKVIDENLPVKDAPELFCFGLLKEFDIPQIEALVSPRTIRKVELPSEPTPAQENR